MKKLILSILFIFSISQPICSAAAPTPTKKVFLFYMVSDAVLACQNVEEDIVEGSKELEKELVSHYNKRFLVQGVKRFIPDKPISSAENRKELFTSLFSEISAGQTPFIVGIALEGQGESSTLYQNAYGAKKVGVAPSINVRLLEIIPNSDSYHFYDYGVQSYSSGTFAVGMNIFAAQEDPRKNTKNAIRASFRDACKFDDSINKYANPADYEREYNRFTGNFKAGADANKKLYADANAKIEKFIAWCNTEDENKDIRQAMLRMMNVMYPTIDGKINYINSMIHAGMYKEQ